MLQSRSGLFREDKNFLILLEIETYLIGLPARSLVTVPAMLSLSPKHLLHTVSPFCVLTVYDMSLHVHVIYEIHNLCGRSVLTSPVRLASF